MRDTGAESPGNRVESPVMGVEGGGDPASYPVDGESAGDQGNPHSATAFGP